MPGWLSDDVLASWLAELVAALFVAAATVSLRSRFARADLLTWGWAWAAASAWAAAGLIAYSVTLTPAPFTALRALARSVAFLQATGFLIGARRLTLGQDTPPWLRRLVWASPALGIGSALVSSLSLPSAIDVTLRALASSTVGVAAIVAAFWLQRQQAAQPSIGARLMTVALLFYGLLKLFSPTTLGWLGLLQGAGPALYIGFSLAPVTFVLGCGISLLEDRERALSLEHERVRVSEQKFATLFGSSPDPVLLTTSREGRIVAANANFERVFGHAAAEVVGKTTVEAGLWADPEERPALLAEAETGPLRQRAVTLVDRGGRRLSVELSSQRVVIDGEPHSITTLRDVSERKRAQEALRSSEERLRLMSEATFEGICISEDGMIVDANDQFARMLGYSLEELPGMPLSSLVAPGDRGRVAEAIRLQLDAPYQIVGLRKDGSLFPVDVRGRQMKIGARQLRVSAVRDMSERSELLERLALVGRATSDAVWDWDLKTGQLWWSEGVQTLFGYAPRDVRPDLGWWSERVHPDEAERVSASMHAAIDTGSQVWSEEYRFRRGDGTYADVFDRGFLLRDQGGTAVRMVGAMLDVSERKRVQGALHRSERLAAIGALVAGVAHEVRTPLFGISANVDAYAAQLQQVDESGEFIESLRAQVNRLSALMRDLLEYGRPPWLQLSRGGVDDAIRKALRSCARAAETAGVRLVAELRQPPYELPRDPSRIEQVFENVLSNAIHHSPRGGSVRVSASYGPEDSPGVWCVVEDEGPGIPEKDLPRVFEPFFSRRRGGTGLGLAIVQRIVEEHGGQVTAANRPEGGASFTISLPASRVGAGLTHA